MNHADCLIDGEDHDDPFDLPPATEIDRIAEIAIAIGTDRRFHTGINPETGEHIGRKAGVSVGAVA